MAILQRKIDEVPSRAELTQYQKRFIELYSQGGFLLSTWSNQGLCSGNTQWAFHQPYNYTTCLHRLNLCLFLLCLSVSATHKETKQFFTLYNTLDDKKVYLEKEVNNPRFSLYLALNLDVSGF